MYFTPFTAGSGVSVWGGVSVQGDSLSRGSLSKGVSVQEGSLSDILPPSCGQADACENITLPLTSFAGSKYNAYLEGKSTLSNDSSCIYFQELVDLVQGMKAQYDMQISVSIFIVPEVTNLVCVEVFNFHSRLSFNIF